MITPFVQIGTHWFVDVNWRPDCTELPYRLSLRRLNDDEIAWLLPRLEDSVVEVWARLFPNDESIEFGSDVFDGEEDGEDEEADEEDGETESSVDG